MASAKAGRERESREGRDSRDGMERQFEKLLQPVGGGKTKESSKQGGLRVGVAKAKEAEEERREKVKVASLNLISMHRQVIAGMLGMVKKEMSMVNETDADRDNIEEYLEGLEALQEKKVEMIGSVREALGQWKEERVRFERERDVRAKMEAAFESEKRVKNRRMSAAKWLGENAEDGEDDEAYEDMR